MARKEMYTLKVDGRVVWTSNRLPYMKKIANETLELDNGFFAEIRPASTTRSGTAERRMPYGIVRCLLSDRCFAP